MSDITVVSPIRLPTHSMPRPPPTCLPFVWPPGDINGMAIKGLLPRKPWWLRVQILEYNVQGKLWAPYADGAWGSHVVLLDELCWWLPATELQRFVAVRRARARPRARVRGPPQLGDATLSDIGLRWVIAHGNLTGRFSVK